MDLTAERFMQSLLSVDKQHCGEIIGAVLQQEGGNSEMEALVSESLERIGADWEAGEVSLAQVYMSGVICEELLEQNLRGLAQEKRKQPRVAILVLHDHHLLGKRIVLSVLRANGYEVEDLGGGVSVEQAVEKVKELQIEVLLVSTLMLHAADKVRALREVLDEEEQKVLIAVGGAPFRQDQELWQRVGADFFCRNANDALRFLEGAMKND